MELSFAKLHGLGNDFVFIDDRDRALKLTDAQVSYLCDRHFGIGADGVMILPPPGLHPSQDEIYAFYKHISENVTLPVMIYNNPGSSGVNILPAALDKIADLPHMGFLKESTGDTCW